MLVKGNKMMKQKQQKMLVLWAFFKKTIDLSHSIYVIVHSRINGQFVRILK